MNDKLPCLECLTLPMCRSRLTSGNTERWKQTLTCPILSEYCEVLDERLRYSIAYNFLSYGEYIGETNTMQGLYNTSNM